MVVISAPRPTAEENSYGSGECSSNRPPAEGGKTSTRMQHRALVPEGPWRDGVAAMIRGENSAWYFGRTEETRLNTIRLRNDKVPGAADANKDKGKPSRGEPRCRRSNKGRPVWPYSRTRFAGAVEGPRPYGQCCSTRRSATSPTSGSPFHTARLRMKERDGAEAGIDHVELSVGSRGHRRRQEARRSRAGAGAAPARSRRRKHR